MFVPKILFIKKKNDAFSSEQRCIKYFSANTVKTKYLKCTFIEYLQPKKTFSREHNGM